MAHGSYAVVGGNIEAQYDYNNGASTAVLVRINLQKNATTVVSVGVARPKFGASAVSGHNVVLSGTGGAPTRHYLVLNSTNTSPLTANWTCVATSFFDGLGNFAFTNIVSAMPSQGFYRLQVP